MTTDEKLAQGMALSCLTVSNLKKSKEFFVDLLGFELINYQEDFNWMEVGTNGKSQIGIGAPNEHDSEIGIQPGSNAICSIDVANVETAKAFLESKGVQFIGEIIEVPDQVKMVMFQDFDGNKFFLTQHLNK
jgi:predicted enzyme related to lactoylglutathione lyase